MLPAVELKAMLLVGQSSQGAESWIGRLGVSVWGCLVANVSIRASHASSVFVLAITIAEIVWATPRYLDDTARCCEA